jgi:hypothetical protein
MKRKQTNGSAPTDTSALSTERIDYYKAVVEARELLAHIDGSYYRLGQLVYEVAEAAEYGDRTLANFADAVGVAKCTLDRYANVYRTWKDILAPGLKPSYSVLRELAPYATNPEIVESIRDNPNITKRDALEMKRKLKDTEEEQRQEEQENDWRKDNRRWFCELYTHAQEISHMVEVAFNLTPEKQRDLLQAIDKLLLMNLGGIGRTLVDFVEHFEALEAEEEEAGRAAPEASVPIERAHLEASVQARAAE